MEKILAPKPRQRTAAVVIFPCLVASVVWEEVLAPTVNDEQNLEPLMVSFWTWMMISRLSLTNDRRLVSGTQGSGVTPVFGVWFIVLEGTKPVHWPALTRTLICSETGLDLQLQMPSCCPPDGC